MTAPLVEWPAVYPWGLFGKGLEPADFTRLYRHRLHRLTPRIMRELRDLREGYGDVALLCFERSDAFCHRHVLLAWLQEHGIPVEEVMPPTTSVADGLL
jgi:hypothetical protein